jgi:hypothetical protein
VPSFHFTRTPSHISALRFCIAAAAAFTCLAAAEIPPAVKAEGKPEPIYRLDLSAFNTLDLRNPAAVRRAWDTTQMAASIQGNANRIVPRLFLRCIPESDDFWWNYLREEHGWIKGRKVVEVGSVGDLLKIFKHGLVGVVTYREDEAHSSNLAATIAGAEGRFILREDEAEGSLYSELRRHPDFPKNVVRVAHAGSGGILDAQGLIAGTRQPATGSAKNDAYRWALEAYLKSGKSGKSDLAYFIDAYWLKKPASGGSFWNSTLVNHDFYISKRAFFCDLNPMQDEVPVDDPGQRPGLDRETLLQILSTMARHAGQRIYAVGGFIPWSWKYVGPDGNFPGTGGKKHPVTCEWEFSKLISAFNGYKDADALGYSGLANASFYQHFPLNKTYPQSNPPLSDKVLRAAGHLDAEGRVIPRQYFTFYCGDYDASAWLNRFVPKFWSDPARGTIPMNWAFNPNLARRVPQAMHYARTKATAQDWFFAGDNGAGYLNPGMLTAPRLDPELPDGWEAWIAHNKTWFGRFGLSMTGFVIDGSSPGINTYGFKGYSRFSPGGIGTAESAEPWGVSPEGVPYARVRDVGHESYSVAKGVENSLGLIKPGPDFRILRTILNSPTWHREVMDGVAASPKGKDACFVSAPIFFELIRKAKSEKPTPGNKSRTIKTHK